MKLKVSVPKIFFVLLVVFLSVMIYTSSFFNVLYDRSFFDEFYEKEGTDELVETPTQKSTEVIAFLNEEIDEIQENNPVFADKSFTDEEIDHLEDVRDVISGVRTGYFVSFVGFIVLVLGFFLSLIIAKDKDSKRKMRIFFMKLQVYVISLCSIALLVMWLLFTFSFDWAFKSFHRIFFEYGTWTFPGDTLSIILFPESIYTAFMAQVFANVFVFIVMLSVLFGFIYVLYKPREKKEKATNDH